MREKSPEHPSGPHYYDANLFLLVDGWVRLGTRGSEFIRVENDLMLEDKGGKLR